MKKCPFCAEDVQDAAIVCRYEPELLRELRSLERRRGGSGRDKVSHPPNGHDDRAAAAAGALVRAAADASETPLMLLFSPTSAEWERRHATVTHDLLSRETREQFWNEYLGPLVTAAETGDECAMECLDRALEEFIGRQDERTATGLRGIMARLQQTIEEAYGA